MNNDRKDEDLIEAHRIAFLKQVDNKMVKYVPTRKPVKRCQSMDWHVKQLIRTVGTGELLEAEKAVKDNPHDSDKLTKGEAKLII